MSLRRSARIGTSAVSPTNELNAALQTLTKSVTAPKRKSKASSDFARSGKCRVENSNPQAAFAVPTTPPPKRQKEAVVVVVTTPLPITPTPSVVGPMLSESKDSHHPLENMASLKPRPAEPNATNAPLATPGDSCVVAYQTSPFKSSVSQESPSACQESPTKKRKVKEIVPPDVGVLPPASANTDQILRDAEAHLVRVDPKLKGLIGKHHCKTFSPEGLGEVVDPFTALSSGIIGQQVSGQAAESIRRKFTALFPETHPAFPSPAQVTAKDLSFLRTAGLSQRKAEYIFGLAEKFNDGELSAQMLISASDEELIERLVAVRGLGRWSVEMFACFGLKRMDVFSTGDLGVQRGMATYKGRDIGKLKNKGGKWKYMSEQEMLDTAARFSPYRSLFMWYMWRIEDVDISVMQNP